MIRALGCLVSVLLVAGAVAVFFGLSGKTAIPDVPSLPISLPTVAIQPPGFPANAVPAAVTRVVDGDTIEVRLNGLPDRVRFVGVNAPETSGQAECYAREAAAYVDRLLPYGAQVGLERDISDRDQFGRLLRYIWLADGRLLNVLLVSEGYAQSSSFPPDVRYQDQILSAQRSARESGKGLWGSCQIENSAAGDAAIEFVNIRGAGREGRASVTIRTAPKTICSIRYYTPSGTESQASGLGNKETDPSGVAVWTWNIGPSTTPGNGSVTVSCGNATATSPIVIE